MITIKRTTKIKESTGYTDSEIPSDQIKPIYSCTSSKRIKEGVDKTSVMAQVYGALNVRLRKNIDDKNSSSVNLGTNLVFPLEPTCIAQTLLAIWATTHHRGRLWANTTMDTCRTSVMRIKRDTMKSRNWNGIVSSTRTIMVEDTWKEMQQIQYNSDKVSVDDT